MTLAPRQREFADELAALLRRYADVAGPVLNPDNEPLDAEALDDGTPVANAALTEWITVMCWVDLDTGDAYITKACDPGMLAHHQQGLLRGWLIELER